MKKWKKRGGDPKLPVKAPFPTSPSCPRTLWTLWLAHIPSRNPRLKWNPWPFHCQQNTSRPHLQIWSTIFSPTTLFFRALGPTPSQPPPIHSFQYLLLSIQAFACFDPNFQVWFITPRQYFRPLNQQWSLPYSICPTWRKCEKERRSRSLESPPTEFTPNSQSCKQ